MSRVRSYLGLFLLFVLLAAVALLTQRSALPQRYDPQSNRPDGLLLLAEWLGEMGYEVASTGSDAFALGQADMLFAYPGARGFTNEDGARLEEWVEAGGSLVLVAPEDEELQDRFRFSTMRGAESNQLQQSQPLLPDARAVITGTAYARRLDILDDSPAVVLLAVEGEPAQVGLAVQRRGAGWVWLLSEDFTLTNQELTDNRASAQIVPALLRGVPSGGQILFDTYHLAIGESGGSDGQIESLQEWAYTTPSGWAAIFVLILGFGFLLLQGRRLGPALPTITQGRRREAAEFVAAMAGLQRRAGVRGSIAQHQRHRLKQGLGRPWQLPADLPDEEFVTRLAVANPALDTARLRALLAALSKMPDEAALVSLAQEVDSLLEGEWVS